LSKLWYYVFSRTFCPFHFNGNLFVDFPLLWYFCLLSDNITLFWLLLLFFKRSWNQVVSLL
jgi:hypothetical protein